MSASRNKKRSRGAEGRNRSTSEIKSAQRSRRKGFSFKRWLEQHQLVAIESLIRLLAQTGSSLMTWAVIGIALALPLCLNLAVINLQGFGDGVEQATRLSLYMNTGISEQNKQQLIQVLESREEVRGFEWIGADQALEEFELASGFGEVLAGLDENPLPSVMMVTPSSSDPAANNQLLSDLAEISGVDSVELDMEWLMRLNSILDLVRRLTLGLSMLLCLGVLLVIGNTIRMAIENRRAEIVVVKLVGGTNAYVSRPFLYTGLWYGVGGGLLASLVVTIGLLLMQGPVSNLAGLYGDSFGLKGLGASGLLLVMLTSGFLGWLGAWIAVQKHLRLIEPR